MGVSGTRILTLWTSVALAAALSPLAATAAESDDRGCDWPKYGRDLGQTFAQDAGCTDLSVTTAPRLRPKWFMRAPDSVTASPSVVDGVVYVGDWDGTFYALPADATGLNQPLWTFEVLDENQVAFGTIVSSAAVADVGDTRVVTFGGGATLYVLDAATGEKLASVCTDPREDPAEGEPVRCRGSDADIEIESSPAVVSVRGQTWVLVGHSVHNRAGVGRTGMLAFRLRTDPWELQPVWKFDPETGRTYRGGGLLTHDAGNGSGCGGVWGSPAVDTDKGLVFFGTANCTTDEMPEGEFGGEALWAVDLRTGRQRWMFTPRGLNRLDDDFGASPNLLPNDLVGIGGKDGVYYAFERDGDAEPVWQTQLGQPGRLIQDFAIGGIIGTTAVGEVDGEPAVFATTAFSTPFADTTFTPDASLAEDPGRMLSLHAISAVDGELLWRSPLSRQSYGAPTYANGVLLVPSTFSLSLWAFHADTGLPLWTHPLNGAPSSAPAIVGDSVYIGAGTRTTDAEWKAFGGDPLEPVLGAHALSPLSGVWAFTVD